MSAWCHPRRLERVEENAAAGAAGGEERAGPGGGRHRQPDALPLGAVEPAQRSAEVDELREDGRRYTGVYAHSTPASSTARNRPTTASNPTSR